MTEVLCQQEEPGPDHKPTAHYYLCGTCGDNYLAVKHHNSDTSCDVTYRHLLDRVPRLLRVAHFETDDVTGEQELASWEYFIDCRQVGQVKWHRTLKRMRQTLTEGVGPKTRAQRYPEGSATSSG